MNRGHHKILIIDDEEIVLDSCAAILEDSEFELVTASNGNQGLALLNEFNPDLVFVDLKMPGISGIEVLEKIHEHDSTIVTIVITGFATVSSAVEAMKQGAYDFLPKPFTPDQFRLITQRGIEKRKLVLETIALRREKEILRENFAAIVSHELKSPLGAVQQNLFVLEAELGNLLSEKQQERFGKMKSRIAGLIDLIHTWLRVISVDIDAIKDQFEPMSISSVLENAVECVQPHATRKDINIVTSLKGSTSLILGEESTLTEALVNITTNAIKYSHPESAIDISVEEQGKYVTISITDNGVGIAEEDLPHIFDDFYRGKSGRETARGAGIGLAISRRIIETHEGTISAESELGKGSTFVIQIPAYEPNGRS
jgi:signal transduction histidine kinase